MNGMGKVILYVNPARDKGYRASNRVREMLEARGRPYAVCSDGASAAREAKDAELAVTFGGDGTILHCARAVAPFDVPILGVNLGRKGFMAELEAGEVDRVALALDGGFSLEPRMTLDVAVRRGEELYRNFALNEAVVKGVTRVVELSVLGDGKPIMRFSGDGLIVSTPTGSTAYSMAAGGPIVEPDAENIIITPICPHLLAARSYVLAPHRRVTVSAARGKRVFLSADGGESVPLEDGDSVEIRRSDLTVKLARLAEGSFYEKVSRKLGETG